MARRSHFSGQALSVLCQELGVIVLDVAVVRRQVAVTSQRYGLGEPCPDIANRLLEQRGETKMEISCPQSMGRESLQPLRWRTRSTPRAEVYAAAINAPKLIQRRG